MSSLWQDLAARWGGCSPHRRTAQAPQQLPRRRTALKQSKVLRVAVRVELWGSDDTTDHQLATSTTVNSGTAPVATGETPEIDVRTAPCRLWTRAFVSIRWSDYRLSSVTFDMPAGYNNLDAHC